MTKKIWLIITMGVLVTLLAAACAPATSLPEDTAVPEGTAVPEDTAVTEPASPKPKIFTFLMWQQFIDLDPPLAMNSEQVVLNLVYENLVYLNPPGSDEQMRPGLATSWDKNEDATEWTFHLREGVTFQDGLPFNAYAVKATIEHYLAAEGLGCSWMWGSVDDMEVIDDYTIKIHGSEPIDLELISTGTFCGEMMSPGSVDQPKEWYDSGQGAGTGPYMYESFEKGQRLILTRFDDYWRGWQDNQFDKVVFEIVEDEVQRVQMIQTGEADLMRDIPPDMLPSLQANSDLKVYVDPSYQHLILLINTQKPPTDNKLVRQALAYSFPYDEIIERGQGVFTQARGFVPAAMWGYCEDCLQYSYDPDKARELLKEAGYPDGISIEMTYTTGAYPHVWPTEMWVFPASEVGIDIDTKGMTFSAMWSYGQQDPQTAQHITIQQWWPTYATPYDPLFSMFHSEDEILFNQDYYRNPVYDELIDRAQALSGVDREAASELFIEAQKILVEDSPAIPVMEILNTTAINVDIDGFVDMPGYPGVVFVYELTTTR